MTTPSTASPIEQLSAEVQTSRSADYPVSPLFLNRWSPRAYASRHISDETLHSVLEAARWAPSSGNQQPWRFVVARTPEQRELFKRFIRLNNRLWTDHAPVLLLLASATRRADGLPNGAHAFDTGAAWASLALQATLLGLSTRAVGGFDRDEARIALNVPDDIELHAVVALGYRGDAEQLAPDFIDKEKPNARKPLAESIVDGAWPSSADANEGS